MTVTHKLIMDFTQAQATHRIEAVQGDSCTRTVELTLLENGTPWTFPEGTAVMIRYRKPDGTGGCYDTLPDGTCAWTAADSTLTFVLTPQMLTCPGCVLVQAELIRGASSLATFTFQLLVEQDPSLGTCPSEDYISWNQWAQIALDNVLEKAKQDWLRFCVDPQEPEYINVLWFNTSSTAEEDAALPELSEDATTNQQSTDAAYDFTIL